MTQHQHSKLAPHPSCQFTGLFCRSSAFWQHTTVGNENDGGNGETSVVPTLALPRAATSAVAPTSVVLTLPMAAHCSKLKSIKSCSRRWDRDTSRCSWCMRIRECCWRRPNIFVAVFTCFLRLAFSFFVSSSCWQTALAFGAASRKGDLPVVLSLLPTLLRESCGMRRASDNAWCIAMRV